MLVQGSGLKIEELVSQRYFIAGVKIPFRLGQDFVDNSKRWWTTRTDARYWILDTGSRYSILFY